MFSAALTAAVTPVYAQSFNIDFGTEYGAVSSTYGAASGQTGTWNEITQDGPVSLLGLSGATSGVSYHSAAGLDYSSTIAKTTSSDEYNLLCDGMDVMNGTWNFSITGLANGNYTIYYYESASTAVSTGEFTVNGVSATVLASTSPTLCQNNHWDLQVTVTDGTLSFVGSSSQDGSNYYGLAGLQIVGAVPEPSTYAFFGGAAALGLVLIRRRRK